MRISWLVTALVCVLVWSGAAQAATKTVCASGCDYGNSAANVQTALDAAACGDTLVFTKNETFTVTAGTPWYLKTDCSSSGLYITLTSSGSLPPAGTRISPAYSAEMAKLTSGDTSANGTSVFVTNFATSYYKIIGLELSYTATTRTGRPTLVNIGESGSGCGGCGHLYITTQAEVPNHIIFDRVYVHGAATGNLAQAIIANGDDIYVTESYITNVQLDQDNTLGLTESHAIVAGNANGLVSVTNTYFSTVGSCLHSGGGGQTLANAIPTIIFRNNLCTAPVSAYLYAARVGGTYGGIHWARKNCFEFKNAKNSIIDHNIFGPNWSDAQDGTCILMQVSATHASDNVGPEFLDCTWCTISNTTFTNNIIRHTAQMYSILGTHTSGMITAPPADGLTIRNVLAYDISADWGWSDKSNNVVCLLHGQGFKNVTLNHVTCENDGSTANPVTATNMTLWTGVNALRPTLFEDNFSVSNSFFRENQYGVTCSGDGQGTSCLNTMTNNGAWTFSHNVIQSASPYITYPATTLQPTLVQLLAAFTDPASGHTDDAVNYTVVAGSVYKAGGVSQADDGTDIGVNMCNGSFPDPTGDGKTAFNCNPVKVPLLIGIVACGLAAPVVSGTVTAGPRSISLCHSGKDVTGWALLDNVLRQSLQLSTDDVADANGLKLYQGVFQAGVGVHQIAVLPIYGPAGDGPASLPFSLVVLPSPIVKVAPTNVRVQ